MDSWFSGIGTWKVTDKVSFKQNYLFPYRKLVFQTEHILLIVDYIFENLGIKCI